MDLMADILGLGQIAGAKLNTGLAAGQGYQSLLGTHVHHGEPVRLFILNPGNRRI